MGKETINNLEENFKEYIKLLREFGSVEKAELNDFCQAEEVLREEITNSLNKLKEDYF
jgi:hypothetical protein